MFDPGRLLVVRVGNLNDLKLRVFDLGHLFVVRVGNWKTSLINKLRVFDLGRLFVVRGGELENEFNH